MKEEIGSRRDEGKGERRKGGGVKEGRGEEKRSVLLSKWSKPD